MALSKIRVRVRVIRGSLVRECNAFNVTNIKTNQRRTRKAVKRHLAYEDSKELPVRVSQMHVTKFQIIYSLKIKLKVLKRIQNPTYCQK